MFPMSRLPVVRLIKTAWKRRSPWLSSATSHCQCYSRLLAPPSRFHCPSLILLLTCLSTTTTTTTTTIVNPWPVHVHYKNVAHPMSLPFPRHGGSSSILRRFMTNDSHVASSYGGGGEDENNNKTEPPEYKPEEKAIVTFANPYFYENKQYASDARRTRQALLNDMTVGQVYYQFIHEHEEGFTFACGMFADEISARVMKVCNFFKPATVTVEQALAKKKLIILSGLHDVDRCNQRFVDNVPTLDQVWTTGIKGNNGNDNKSRALPLYLVLGPSGSGKTFFALKYLSERLVDPLTKEPFPEKNPWDAKQQINDVSTKEHVVVYVHPKFLVKNTFENENPLTAKQMIDEVKERCAMVIEQEIKQKIDMNMCIIFDEASDKKDWFESRNNLEDLCKEAQKLATSVTIVVAGTGITGRQLSSTKDAYFFRMRPWSPGDLRKILMKKMGYLLLETSEAVDMVVNSIVAHPILSALATNAHSAHVLVDSIIEMTYKPLSWERHLHDLTPVLVTNVVRRCIGMEPVQRRRVAAFVLYALQQLKKGETTLPTFEGLRYSEKAVAESLLQYNLEWSNDKQETLLTANEDFAFTVTPAIAIILYSMTGVYATLVPGWKNEQEIAALYAARQLILGCMERYTSDLNNGMDETSCLKQLDESLGKIRLLRLRKQLPSTSDVVTVPIVDDSTILINDDMASFADIIYPYTLIQARPTKDKTADVKLYDDMQRCGLLKENCDNRLIRGLLATWQGRIDMEDNNGMPEFGSVESKDKRNPQLFKAFPESLLSLVTPLDQFRFGEIHERSRNMTIDHGASIPLPALDGTTITYIVSTNAENMNLQLTPSEEKTKLASSTWAEMVTGSVKPGNSTPVTMIITEANLNDDMEIDVDKLSDPDAKLAWTSFIRDKILDGIKLKFLFTG